ncbi:hypothetical protein KM043_003215 [Ampulex compressa]|nr:hypothetical protein KM043_003215 [Ampulex compressa]
MRSGGVNSARFDASKEKSGARERRGSFSRIGEGRRNTTGRPWCLEDQGERDEGFEGSGREPGRVGLSKAVKFSGCRKERSLARDDPGRQSRVLREPVESRRRAKGVESRSEGEEELEGGDASRKIFHVECTILQNKIGLLQTKFLLQTDEFASQAGEISAKKLYASLKKIARKVTRPVGRKSGAPPWGATRRDISLSLGEQIGGDPAHGTYIYRITDPRGIKAQEPLPPLARVLCETCPRPFHPQPSIDSPSNRSQCSSVLRSRAPRLFDFSIRNETDGTNSRSEPFLETFLSHFSGHVSRPTSEISGSILEEVDRAEI